jgi:hypothetical protein
VRDLLYAHSWRNTSQRKVAERRPTANTQQHMRSDDEERDVVVNDGHSDSHNGNGVIHVDDEIVHDDRDDNEPRLSDLASFDAAMSELSRASAGDVRSLSRDERHARAHRLLSQFLDAAGLDMNEL